MKNCIPLILIGIAVLGLFIWVQETMRPGNLDKRMDQRRLFDLDAESLISIEFMHASGTVRCVRENGVWMTGDAQGSRGRADAAFIWRMISELNSIGKGTAITEKQLLIRGLNTGDYGFEHPAVSITTVDHQGRQTWLVGRNTPLGNMVYAKSAGENTIYTIPDAVLKMASGTYDQFRNRVIFSGEAGGGRRIEIRGPAGFVQLVKDPQAGWRIQQPITDQADSKEVEDFIERLYRFRIENFIADNVSDFSFYGLQEERRQISVTGSGGLSSMLIIGDDIPERLGFVYARRAEDASVFSLSAEVLQLLNIPPERFRNVSVLSMNPSAISSIQVSKEGELFSLSADESGRWSVTRPAVWDADAESVAALVRFWSTAAITEFPAEPSDKGAEWMFEFGSAEIGETNRITVLAVEEARSGLLIRLNDNPIWRRINHPQIPNFFGDPLNYKTRIVWTLDRRKINKISLFKKEYPAQTLERRDDRAFIPIGVSENLKIHAASLDRFLRKLERLQTAGYVTYNPRNLEIYGLEEPMVDLYIGLSDSNQLGHVLLIGKETANGFYSMMKGRDVVFYLDKMTVERLTADLVSITNP